LYRQFRHSERCGRVATPLPYAVTRGGVLKPDERQFCSPKYAHQPNFAGRVAYIMITYKLQAARNIGTTLRSAASWRTGGTRRQAAYSVGVSAGIQGAAFTASGAGRLTYLPAARFNGSDCVAVCPPRTARPVTTNLQPLHVARHRGWQRFLLLLRLCARLRQQANMRLLGDARQHRKSTPGDRILASADFWLPRSGLSYQGCGIGVVRRTGGRAFKRLCSHRQAALSQRRLRAFF